MIDYAAIGAQIRKARQSKGVTQEKLAEACNVGTAHISHLECGHTIPSMPVFIAIVNYLGCSADDLLCRDVESGRPAMMNWLTELVSDCDRTEMKIIADMVVSLKDTLRRNKREDCL